MANLSIADLKKRENPEKFANKIFHVNGAACEFATENGRFHCSGYEIRYPQSQVLKEERINNPQSNMELAKAFADNIRNLPVRSQIFIKGHYGKKSNTLVSITKLLKTEEFGGQPNVGGKKINRGEQFEIDLQNRLVDCLNGRVCEGKYASQTLNLLEMVESETNQAAYKSIHEGGKNQPRPIVGSSPSQLHIAPKSPKDHGPKLTDITLQLGRNGNIKQYLSLKFGGTLTFMNSGVGKILTQSEIREGKIKNIQGLAVLDLFGVDNEKFCKVWAQDNDDPLRTYNEKPKVNKAHIKGFLRTAIGANYWMVHALENGDINTWYVSPQLTEAASSNISDPVVHYGGMKKGGRRIDVVFRNEYYEFKMNIRNKQSGFYPSHIMLDYKSLAKLPKVKL